VDVLRFPRSLPRRARLRLEQVLSRMPSLEGRPVRVRFRPALSAWRGRLLSGKPRGTSVHAASFLRRRSIVFDAELLEHPGELARIFVHELFHLAWLRLGNPRRRSFEDLVAAEIRRHARGELGWSAERRKLPLAAVDIQGRSRRWREYVCESFCDTAAWLYAGVGRHPEFTLATSLRKRRRRWFRDVWALSSISI